MTDEWMNGWMANWPSNKSGNVWVKKSQSDFYFFLPCKTSQGLSFASRCHESPRGRENLRSFSHFFGHGILFTVQHLMQLLLCRPCFGSCPSRYLVSKGKRMCVVLRASSQGADVPGVWAGRPSYESWRLCYLAGSLRAQLLQGPAAQKAETVGRARSNMEGSSWSFLPHSGRPRGEFVRLQQGQPVLQPSCHSSQTGQGSVPEALLISAEMMCGADILRFAHSASQSGFQRRTRSRRA